MRAFLVGCRGARIEPDERAFFRQADPLGFILFKRNVQTREQLYALTQELCYAVGRQVPVLIDQEGGRVQRLTPPLWPAYPAAATLDALGDDAPQAVRLVMQLIAQDLRSCGINVDCAPVLDVREDTTHEVIGTRAYSHDPDRVAELGRAAIEGLVAGGVAPIVKHIPGHGRAQADSHLETPRVRASRDDLARDFAPFYALRDAPAAMTAHVIYSALDPEATATMSVTIIRDVIRGQIGFDGLLISDDVSMKALHGKMRTRAHDALAAGCDLVLHCNGDMREAESVAEGVSPLVDRGLERALAFLSITTRTPEPFDIAHARTYLQEML